MFIWYMFAMTVSGAYIQQEAQLLLGKADCITYVRKRKRPCSVRFPVAESVQS